MQHNEIAINFEEKFIVDEFAEISRWGLRFGVRRILRLLFLLSNNVKDREECN